VFPPIRLFQQNPIDVLDSAMVSSLSYFGGVDAGAANRNQSRFGSGRRGRKAEPSSRHASYAELNSLRLRSRPLADESHDPAVYTWCRPSRSGSLLRTHVNNHVRDFFGGRKTLDNRGWAIGREKVLLHFF
jgi:hypothetical protein